MEPAMLPMPDGTERPFRPNRPVSCETLEGIRCAAQLAHERKDWTREMTIEQGRRDLERAWADTIARGIAIDEDWEAAIGD